MQPAQFAKLISTVALLEVVVCEMLAEDALSHPTPEAAFDRFATRLRKRAATRAGTYPNEPEAQMASLVGLNVLDDFCDRVRGVIQAKDQDSRS
jgi:hypothetical protein